MEAISTPSLTKSSWTAQERAELSRILKAIAHPVRLSILDMLSSGNRLTVTEIYTHLRADQSAISHHLSLMRQRGVVQSHRNGKYIHYSLKNSAYLNLVSCLASEYREENISSRIKAA